MSGSRSDEKHTAPRLASPDSIQGLQYLRAVAALMVIFHHARWHFPDGSVLYTVAWSEFGSRGVDIFFVISGFVMAHSTRHFDTAYARGAQAVSFFARRLIRVVPLYWIATLWTARKIIWHGAVDTDLIKDFLFFPRFREHDHGMVWPIVFQGWTINYEMLFYGLFALSMLAGRWRFRALSLSLLVMIVLGVFASITHAQTNSAAIIFYTSNMLVEFLMGVWLCLAMRGTTYRPPTLLLCGVAIAGFALLALPNPDTVRGFADGLVAVAIVWSTVLLSRGVDVPLLNLIGDASYSIYLFHMVIFDTAKSLFRSMHLLEVTAFNMIVVIALYIAAATAVGLVMHVVVEKPLLKAMRALFPLVSGAPRRVRP